MWSSGTEYRPSSTAGRTKLTQLHLEHNNIGSSGAVAISVLLSHADMNLQQLVLHNNNIGPQGAYGLSLPLANRSMLRSLDMRSNRLQLGGTRVAPTPLRCDRRTRGRHADRTRTWQAHADQRSQDQPPPTPALAGGQRGRQPRDAPSLVRAPQ